MARPILASGYRGIDPSACVFGSVDTVVAKFREYAAMGITDITRMSVSVPPAAGH